MQVLPGAFWAQRLCGVAVIGLALAAPAAAQTVRPKAIERGARPIFQTVPHIIDRTVPHKFFTINSVLANRDRGIPPTVTLVSAPSTGPGADPGENQPFGVLAFRAPEGLLWVKWRGIESAMREEDDTLARCRADAQTCSREASRFEALVAKAKALAGRAQLEAVTHAVNGMVRYLGDQAHHGTPDLWTAPLATLASGVGDCEDYAILKYRVLRDAGVSREQLRIVLLRDTGTREAHAVLAAQADGRWYILDNRRAGFYEDKALPHYMPLFALDHEGVKLLAARYAIRPQHDSEVADSLELAELRGSDTLVPGAASLGLRASVM